MPPQICLGRLLGRVHNNRQPSIAIAAHPLPLDITSVECDEVCQCKVWLSARKWTSQSFVSDDKTHFPLLILPSASN
jgi:hypothetical protein